MKNKEDEKLLLSHVQSIEYYWSDCIFWITNKRVNKWIFLKKLLKLKK